MVQIATTPEQTSRLLMLKIEHDTADMYYDPGTEDLKVIPYDMKGSQFGTRAAWSLSALMRLLPRAIKRAYLEYDKDLKHKYHKFYSCAFLHIGMYAMPGEKDDWYAQYKTLASDREYYFGYVGRTRGSEIGWPCGHGYNYFDVIVNLVCSLLLGGFIKTSENKDWKLYSIVIDGKKYNRVENLSEHPFDMFTPYQTVEEVIKNLKLDTRKDINWYHVEQDDEFNFGRMEDKYYTNNYFI